MNKTRLAMAPAAAVAAAALAAAMQFASAGTTTLNDLNGFGSITGVDVFTAR